MKKFFGLQIIPILFYLLAVSFFPVQAAGNLSNAFDTNTLSAASGNTANAGTDVYQIIGTVIQALLGLLGVIFLSLIVYGGVSWMLAEGEETKIEKAQGIIRSAIIGLVVVVAAYAISFFVIGALNKAALGK